MLTLQEVTKGADWVGLGIAGNQADHLNQAGEANDFKDVVAPDNAPKGMFPWFIQGSSTFLGVNPLSKDLIRLNGETKAQPEPEIALIVKFQYSESSERLLESLSVEGFTVFNDCSRRIEAPKISIKKNWGEASQGMLDCIVPLHDFEEQGGVINQYRICCYLVREGKLLQYGLDTAVSDYCYFNEELVHWMVSQMNTQQEHGPLEPIAEMLKETKPSYGIIGIGATCYTEFGNSESRFLLEGDRVIVTAYHSKDYSQSEVERILLNSAEYENNETLLILNQEVST